MEHQATARRGRIDALGERLKANSALAKRMDRLNEVRQGAAEPIKPPHHQHIAGLASRERLIQTRASAPATGGLIGEDIVATGSGQRLQLQIRILLVC